ncbi:kinase-like domain-containing protein [Fusarium pseudocircinatum]|uniref:Kinase-like domain-containing protein n=1 Tax=Fusarium pseudocircinatum TaxID=56676 RepID=A0A8H5KSE6_9HYPO|nr:kinase-like domain-containing protein [Fusarium pseudocircinatum]
MAQPIPSASSTSHVPAYVNESRFVLCIVDRFGDKIPPGSHTLGVEVLHIFPNTTSPVKLVQFNNGRITERTVLKLYDRTHPGRVRKSTAPSMAAEGAYRRWNGQFADIVMARFEAAIWYEFDQRHKTELRAYAQLESMQGTKIPRLYANVRLSLSVIDGGRRATPEEEEFLCIPGLLLQYCDCRRLRDLHFPGTAQIESDQLHVKWAGLAQRTVDAIHEINAMGILFRSYNNNAIFKIENGSDSIIIDFAEAVFKEDLIETWIERRERRGFAATESPPWRRDIKYWEEAKSCGNPAAFDKAFRIHLWTLDIYYLLIRLPDYHEIIGVIRGLALVGLSQNIQTQGG